MDTFNQRLLAREERARFREVLVEGLSELVFAFTPEGKLVDWNARVSEVTGYSDEEISAMRPIAFVAPGDRRRVLKKVDQVLQKGRDAVETHLLTKDGREIPYEFTGTLLHLSSRSLICGTGHEISQRRRREEELRQSERKYRRLFEEAKVPVSISSPEGKIIDVNPAFCDLLGYDREELIGRTVVSLHANDSAPRKIMQQIDKEGAVEDREVRLRRRDGDVIIGELSSSARRGPNGELEAYQTFIRDVTAQRRAEEALRESEQKFRTLAERALVGIGLLRGGGFAYVNPALAEIFGYEAEEVIGTSPEDFFHPADRPFVRRRVEQRLAGEREEAHYEARIITKSGELRMVEVSGSRLIHEGQPAIIGTVQDVTERRQLQREILNIQETERRRLGQDLHDGVGSQLSGLAMMVSGLVQDAREQSPDLAAHLDEIKSLIQETSQDVRRISRGLNPVNLDDMGLPAALERLARNTTTEDGYLCTCEVVGEVPDLPEESARHMYWIAQEAMTNARKYADAGHIRLRLEREEGHLILIVADDGQGFDVQADSGEGLGLRTMQYRVDLLGGYLDVDSRPGQGTRVRVRVSLT